MSSLALVSAFPRLPLAMTDELLYRWMSPRRAHSALSRNEMRAGRWSHFLESEGRLARGVSWSLDPRRWRKDELPVGFVAARSRIPNRIYSIAGNRTHFLTLGKTVPHFDPEAYRYEDSTPDEEFVEGSMRPLLPLLLALILPPHLGAAEREALEALAARAGLPVVPSAERALLRFQEPGTSEPPGLRSR